MVFKTIQLCISWREKTLIIIKMHGMYVNIMECILLHFIFIISVSL